MMLSNKKTLFAATLFAAVLGLPAQAQTTSWTADNGNGTFTNPLFYDEFSDPDILRVGDDYYLAGTTMHTVPGLVILHSRDLVNWENVSYCFDRFDFDDDAFSLKNHKEIYGQGIWAPAIRYANGQFYVFSNINGKGLQCFGFKKNGSNGTRIAAVMHVTDPLDLAAVQKDGTQTVFNTEEVRIEPRAGRGQPMVMVLMDNTVAELKKTDNSAKNNAEKN